MAPQSGCAPRSSGGSNGNRHSLELFWRTFGRLALLYFAPLLFLAVFFHIQYRKLVRDSLQAHLEVIAEQQATTFDLFLRERLVNLGNVLDDPRFRGSRMDTLLPAFLQELQHTNPAFVDLGVVDQEGALRHYAGPITYQGRVDYGNEPWFKDLQEGERTATITEIYRGFRDRPHFTIAVRRGVGAEIRVLRAALSPERLSGYLATLEGATEVHAAIVNDQGVLQVATGALGQALDTSDLVPPRDPPRGFVTPRGPDAPPGYAYARLSETPWALVVVDARNGTSSRGTLAPDPLALMTLAIFVLVGMVILIRTRQVVGRQLASEEHEAELSGQLVQAAKLASVGELAAGIAHEINNPLAIIAEEAGVLADALDPELDLEDEEPVDFREHLAAIREAVFRCRDITRKLLTFVRKTEVQVEEHDLHAILDEVLDSLVANELTLAHVAVEKRFGPTSPRVLTDRNQLIQVLVNLVKNAVDAMPEGGCVTVTTHLRGDRVAVSIRDTGCGIPREALERVFMPFFTTKDPGKGTGLGLSVSYSIIRNFGGDFYVESAPGVGSTFTIELPLAGTSPPPSAPMPLDTTDGS